MAVHTEPDLAGTVTGLLDRMRGGDAAAKDELFDLVYGELRDLARYQLARAGRSNRPFEGTELINAACEKLLGKSGLDADNRKHFFFLFGRAMHDVLIGESRRAAAIRRGGLLRRTPLVQIDVDGQATFWRRGDVREALTELRRFDAGAAQVIELRCFAGRTIDETAEMLSRSVASVRRDWSYAKAWLAERLGES